MNLNDRSQHLHPTSCLRRNRRFCSAGTAPSRRRALRGGLPSPGPPPLFTFRILAEGLVEAVGADQRQQGADEGQQHVGVHALGDERAERRGEDAADQQPQGREREGLPTQGREERRRNRDGQEELGGIDGADGLSRIAALDEEVRSDDPAPAAAARRIEEAADEAERRDDLGGRSVWRCMMPR